MPLKANEKQYWERYLEMRPADGCDVPHVTADYAGSSKDTDELLRAYLEGRKTAGSSFLEDYLTANDPIPQVGNYWILLASDGEPSCLLRTVKIKIYKFKDVTEEIAVAEGEGDCSVEYWRRVHAKSYTPHLKAWGIYDIEEATVITEFFRVVFH